MAKSGPVFLIFSFSFLNLPKFKCLSFLLDILATSTNSLIIPYTIPYTEVTFSDKHSQ